MADTPWYTWDLQEAQESGVIVALTYDGRMYRMRWSNKHEAFVTSNTEWPIDVAPTRFKYFLPAPELNRAEIRHKAIRESRGE